MKFNKYSQHKIVQFPDKMNSFREGRIAAPIYVRMKPINRCNHDCFFCVYSPTFRHNQEEGHIDSGMHADMREEDVLPTEKALEILEDFRDIGVKAITYSGGGEPLLHRDICQIMQTTIDYKINLSIITNGQLLTKQRAELLTHAKWVRVSMDYTNSAEMMAGRRVPEASFRSVLRNMEEFARIKGNDCDLSVNYIIYKHNYKDMYDFIHALKDCGVDNVRLSPMWTADFHNYHRGIVGAVNEQLARAADLVDQRFTLDTTYNIESRTHASERSTSKCYFMQIVPVVGADQVVYACHNKAYDSTGAIGSIKNRRFRDLWFSPEAAHVFNTLDPRTACRHQCANDLKNIFIDDLVNGEPDNFV